MPATRLSDRLNCIRITIREIDTADPEDKIVEVQNALTEMAQLLDDLIMRLSAVGF